MNGKFGKGSGKMDCKTAQNMITPYVQRQLDDKQLEEFIDHISGCRECHEELEIFFTIHFALQRLDEEKNISYNIQKMLEDDLAASEKKARRRKLLRFFSCALMLFGELVLAVVLLVQIEIWNSGSIQDTFVYRLMYGEEETMEMLEETDVLQQIETEEGQVKDERKDSIN